MPTTLDEAKDLSPIRLHHHYFYLAFWIVLASAITYGIGDIDFIDALAFASGAATQSGLNPIDLNRLHVLQQLVLWIVAMVTNVIFVNSLLVCIRLYWFRKRLRGVVREAQTISLVHRRKGQEGLESSASHISIESNNRNNDLAYTSADDDGSKQPLLRGYHGELRRLSSTNYEVVKQIAGLTELHVTFDETERQPRHHRTYSSSESYRCPSEGRASLHRSSYDMDSSLSALPALMWQSSIASYSDWNERQKDQLGGIEYRALKRLLVILLYYFLAFHIVGILLLISWAWLNPQYGQYLSENGINSSWWAIFTAASAFNDLGFTLTPDSMESLNGAPFPLLIMSFLIVIGNTAFPCMLRLIIWLLSKFTSHDTYLREELQFLLDHPRRCFTLLFPSAESWRLLGVLIMLNGFDLIVFCTLSNVASTRTAGFSITPLADIHPAIQVSFLVMMYISAFPTAITIRKTNVYSEKSLGVYDDDSDSESDHGPHTRSGLAVHIQRQLGFDLWYVMLGFFLIAVAEGHRLQTGAGDSSFSLFAVLFEIVSAYGTVGLSLGYPLTGTSFCAQFNWVSKLVIVAMQVRGRHRGLPNALDHAILLPYELHREGEGGSGWLGGWLKKRASNLSTLLSQARGPDDDEESVLHY
ncbi:potassium transporter [Aspergillus clavatus NRRL 1]|uniref:Cation transporter, putative n=1 Tax=Aspergillus clavatus (strain ATCC 1007 / CBS 513.65 / DSM 816 / NCTC 3887 / NRRL 1 / QM 1276 / 107) TaxID=344612 RepID=A1CT00_ASPCL|nr:cation transporter, putative [Aspergillus clavatus NRRL 1]EAW06437.1 cation transporter, putative [Aspergillus clavatus NRRL 1]